MIRPTIYLAAVLLAVTSHPVQLRAKGAGETVSLPSPIANATINGTEFGSVKLSDGVWEGEPYVEGGSSRPRVGLAADFLLSGDIDGDGSDESVVVVWQSSGGSGTFNYIAFMKDHGDAFENIATIALGDRVKVLGGSISDGRVSLQLLEHDEDDPACCPSRQATRFYDARSMTFSESERKPE